MAEETMRVTVMATISSIMLKPRCPGSDAVVLAFIAASPQSDGQQTTPIPHELGADWVQVR